MSGPVGNYERRHITEIVKGQLVWDDSLRRWRKVTSVLRYTAETSGRAMVKIVTDISAYHRYIASDEAYLDVLLDDQPAPHVRPLSATERRNAARRGVKDDDDHPPTGAPSPTPTGPADEAAGQPAPGGVANAPQAPTAPAAGVPWQVDQTTDVRARREALRISRAAFATLCGLTAGALWRVENGRPKDDELQRVVDTLEREEAKS